MSVHRPRLVRAAPALCALTALTALTTLACVEPESATEDRAAPLSSTAVSAEGMVVSGSPPATAAGASILAAGGNAADAAVATALALAVTEPSQSGLGGRTQIVFHTAAGEVGGIDATTVVPRGYDPTTAAEGEQGHEAVGIPGTVAGLGRLHAEHGVLSWAEVVAPALRLARVGFALPAGEAARWSAAADGLAAYPSVAALFLDADGRPPDAEATVVQPTLATVLETLAEAGPESFYRGWIADSIAADMARYDGYVTRADLAGYEALDAVVARGRVGDLEVVGSWLPAGGATSIEALRILDAAGVGPASGDSVWAPALAGALRMAYADRDSARSRDPREAAAWVTSDSLARRHGAALVADGWEVAVGGEAGPRPEPDHTTHVAVADGDGFVVALTQSLGPAFGAMVATPSLGFVYASTLGGYLAEGPPGTRAWSSQSPLIVLRGGRPVLSLGGGGGRRIISAAVGTVAHFATGTDLAEALEAPRLHPTGGSVLMDGRWHPEVVPALEAAGWTVEVRERSYFARLNGLARDSAGAWIGVADPSWSGGTASGPRLPSGDPTP